MGKKKDLVDVIRANPGCKAVIDNDCWWLEDADGNELINERGVVLRGDGGYGTGCTYGGDVLQALAVIAGVKIQSV